MEDDVLDDLVAVGVDLVEPRERLFVVDHDAVELVAQSHPIGVHVVRSTKQLDFSKANKLEGINLSFSSF